MTMRSTIGLSAQLILAVALIGCNSGSSGGGSSDAGAAVTSDSTANAAWSPENVSYVAYIGTVSGKNSPNLYSAGGGAILIDKVSLLSNERKNFAETPALTTLDSFQLSSDKAYIYGITSNDALFRLFCVNIATAEIVTKDYAKTSFLNPQIAPDTYNGQIYLIYFDQASQLEWIDRADMNAKSVVTVGTYDDLYALQSPLKIDPKTGKIYLLGSAAHTAFMHIFWAKPSEGTSGKIAYPSNDKALSISLRSPPGTVVGAYWDFNQNKERAISIDLETYAITDIGILGDLYWWFGQCIVSDANDTMYALGTNFSGNNFVYILDMTDGSTRSVPVGNIQTYTLIGNRAGNDDLIITYADGQGIRVISLDPESATAREVGPLGNIHAWNGFVRFHDDLSLVYAMGQDGDANDVLASLNLEDGTFETIVLSGN